MDKNQDRRIRTGGAEDVELLNLGRAVGFTPRRSKTTTCLRAVAGAPRGDLEAQGRIGRLVIGGVKLDLVVVHEDEGTFRVRRRTDETAFRVGTERWSRRSCRDCGGGRPSRQHFTPSDGIALHTVPHGPIAKVILRLLDLSLANPCMPQQAPEPEETVEILKLAHAGDGVTGDGVFVPYTVPGDVVRIAREGARARIRNIVAPGAWRVQPPCPHFGRCGGCVLQHVAREPYLQWKRDLVIAALKQRGFSNIPVDDIHAVSPGTRRRANFKAQASRNGVLVGFYEAASRTLVDLNECPILVPQLADLMEPLRAHLGGLLRPNETAELLATLKLARLSWNGEDVAVAATPVIKIGRFSVALPPDAFLQPTKEGERFLQSQIAASVGKVQRVADLFSGCGTFALALAGERAVHAIDSVPPQIEALTAAAKQGRAKLSSEVRDLFRRPLLPTELSRFDAVVLDPPRPGAAEQSRALAQAAVPRVLYVSCNAASFARDARILADGGYRLDCVRPLDQFLWSPHVELFAEFSR